MTLVLFFYIDAKKTQVLAKYNNGKAAVTCTKIGKGKAYNGVRLLQTDRFIEGLSTELCCAGK